MNRARWTCCGCSGCLVLVFVPIAFIATFLKLGSERPDDVPPPRTYTPVEVKTATHHIDTLKTEAEHDARLAKRGKRVPFHYTITEKDLNAYLSRSPAIAGRMKTRGVTEVHVTLGRGTAGFQAAVPLGDRHLWINAEGPLRAATGGRVFFEPTSVEFGRLNWALPESLKDQMTGRLKSESERPILRLPGEIKEITIVPGKLEIRGVTDPNAVKEPSGSPAPR